MKTKFSIVIVLLAAMIATTSCVSKKKYNESLSSLSQCKKEAKSLTSQLKDANKKNDKLTAELADLQTQKSKIEAGSEEMSQKLTARINELNAMLRERDAKMKEVKEKIKNALASYEGKGIQVETKNGRIYVSLDEQLLFKSGKWDVNDKGVEALNQISEALAAQAEMNIMVEGHTDSIPYKGSGAILDNWDLSVKRATAVVRILLKNADMNPANVIAAGHSQYEPLDPTDSPEALQKNRRTEIIISPNIDEVMKIIE